MGICVGLQALFAGSDEDPFVTGLGLVPHRLGRFDDADKSVPHIGWNDAWVQGRARPQGGNGGQETGDEGETDQERDMYGLRRGSKYYYVHSYRFPYRAGELESLGWTVATATYGKETFVGAVAKGNIVATQFHPEKSGVAGLRVIRSFLTGEGVQNLGRPLSLSASNKPGETEASPKPASGPGLTRRIIACLDVRTNDAGDLVVTKGDQYDVREKTEEGKPVRNLGKPVALASRYYQQGADEVVFLNITSFRDLPLADLPMLEILRQTSKTVFVPLTVGGGIRDTVDPADGSEVSALDIASMYFRSGADKVSLGSDAVFAAEEYHRSGRRLFGATAIERIARAYGNQAVVVSVDPRRVYVPSPDVTRHATIATKFPGPNGERYCWYACTVKGGRETRDLDVVELVMAVEAMGCGELLLNCIDRDGSGAGFDLELIAQVKAAVKIPVIASSGAGIPQHFADVFEHTTTDAALGAGMFHRGEYTVTEVKEFLAEKGLVVRRFEGEL